MGDVAIQPQMHAARVGPIWNEPQFETIASRQTENLVGDSLNGTPQQLDMFGSIQKSIISDVPSASIGRDKSPPDNPIQSLRMNKQQREHDKLLDEVRDNHFGQVQNVVGAYLKEKVTANTIESTEDQMRKRVITNSYRPIKKQINSVSPSNLRSQAGGQAVRTQLPPHLEAHKLAGSDGKPTRNYSEIVSRSIQPKAQVQVPKDLLIMQIAKKQNQISQRNKALMQSQHLQDSLIGSTIDKAGESPFQLPPLPGHQTARARNNTSINVPQVPQIPNVKNSYLDFVQQSINESARRPPINSLDATTLT